MSTKPYRELPRHESKIAKLWDLHKKVIRREPGYDQLGNAEFLAELQRNKAIRGEQV